jgi:hypothetical protein
MAKTKRVAEGSKVSTEGETDALEAGLERAAEEVALQARLDAAIEELRTGKPVARRKG